MTENHWTEIDGVKVVWAAVPGPLRAGLIFRTGRSDETLSTVGHTHLVEHMTLSAIDNPSRANNGFVGASVTGFVTSGRPEDVCSFVLAVCATLGSLPSERFETEKDILVAEAAAQSYDAIANLLAWRYGAVGHGLVGMPEFGLRGATMTQLHEVVAQRFTAGNAVLWLSGPPPADLQLALRPGVKRPIPPFSPVHATYPTWFVDDRSGGLAASAVVPRVAACPIFCEIAQTRLHESLRTERAVSYAPSVLYDPLNADFAHVVLYADSDKDRRVELGDAFGKVFDGLTKVEDAEVEAAQRQLLDHWTGPLAPPPGELALREVQRAAMDWLFEREPESLEQLVAEMATVSAADVEAVGRDVQLAAILAMPSEALIRPWIGEKAPISVDKAVAGREIRSRGARAKRERLVHAADGVGVRSDDGSQVTVRYSQLAAALTYEDGCVCLIGYDGAMVTVEPTLWRNGARVCREILERVPDDLLLDRGSRSMDAIPKPSARALRRSRPSGVAVWSRLLGLSLLVSGGLLGLFVVAVLVPAGVDTIKFDGGIIGVLVAAVLVFVPLALAGLLVYKGIRGLKKGAAA